VAIGSWLSEPAWAKNGIRKNRRGVLFLNDLSIPLPLDVGQRLTPIVGVDLNESEARASSGYGVTALGWNEFDFPAEERPGMDPMQALKGLLTGVLGADTIPLVAAELRMFKHAETPRDDLTAALAAVDVALMVFDPKHMSYDHAKANRLRDDIIALLERLDD